MLFKDLPVGTTFTYLTHTFKKVSNITMDDGIDYRDYNAAEIITGSLHSFHANTEISDYVRD